MNSSVHICEFNSPNYLKAKNHLNTYNHLNVKIIVMENFMLQSNLSSSLIIYSCLFVREMNIYIRVRDEQCKRAISIL